MTAYSAHDALLTYCTQYDGARVALTSSLSATCTAAPRALCVIDVSANMPGRSSSSVRTI